MNDGSLDNTSGGESRWSSQVTTRKEGGHVMRFDCAAADNFRNPDISQCFGMDCFGEVLLCSFESVRGYWKFIGHSHSKGSTLLAPNGQCYTSLQDVQSLTSCYPRSNE